MNTTVYIVLAIIVIISILAMIYITLYYKMLFSKIRVEEAEKVIKEEIQNRLNLINECKKTITKQTKKELTLFNDLEKIVNSTISSYDLEKKVSEGVNMIYLIRTDYPKLDEKKDFREIVRKLGESDTRIEAAKTFYNLNNTKLKHQLKGITAKFVGSINKFKVQPSYDANKEIFNESDDGIKI